MDNRKNNLPDFKELNDRLIAESSSEPSLVIKTNLDPKDSTDENPYYKEGQSEKDKFTSYFEDK
jgi:hypothetical protein